MSDVVIELKNVYKKFRLYHEKRDSVYEAIGGWFNRKKYYENLQVLHDISFSVQKGETFGIIGKNGIGKTTLLRIISGIYKPDRGKVIINGSMIPILTLGLGFHPELTASDNVVQNSILLGFEKNIATQRTEEIMKYAELEKFADTKLKNFSAGMYARLAFSTAIHINPDILIIDEVMAVGDIGFQKKCWDTMVSFKKKGKAIIFVTHDMDVARSQCDKLMFMNKNKAEMIGKPD